jgi:hypothetical protein
MVDISEEARKDFGARLKLIFVRFARQRESIIAKDLNNFLEQEDAWFREAINEAIPIMREREKTLMGISEKIEELMCFTTETATVLVLLKEYLYAEIQTLKGDIND